MFVSSVIAVIVVGIFATPVRADDCDELTYFTFSASVALPGVTLPAGTYRFSHPDCNQAEHILRVSSQDGSKVYATLLAVPDERATPSDKPEVIFGERPAGAPEAIKAWFYPGENGRRRVDLSERRRAQSRRARGPDLTGSGSN
jgi:hypothetical protein